MRATPQPITRTASATFPPRGLPQARGGAAHALLPIENVDHFRRPLRRGETLFRSGDRFNAIYAVHCGSFKICVVDGEGREQVCRFPIAGDVMGLDGLGGGHYESDAVALEDSEVCVVPFAPLERRARDDRSLQKNLCSLLAREIIHDQGMILLLGSSQAEGRVAAFLIGLSDRFRQRGYSSRDFNLRMSRAEIGSYLGLKLETVSRVLSSLAERGLVAVDQKRIQILDPAGLRRVLTTG